MNLEAIKQQCRQDSLDWFGEELANNLPHMVLALCGECGELANLVKKLQRKDFNIDDKLDDIAEETVDVFIYLMNIAALIGLDMEKGYGTKRGINADRFGPVQADPELGDGGAAPERTLRSVPSADGEG